MSGVYLNSLSVLHVSELLYYGNFIVSQMLEKLNEEILSLRQRVETLSKENTANNIVVEEYKKSIQLLQKELSVVSKEEITRLEQALRDSDIIKVSLEKKIEDYVQRLNETGKELSLTKNDYSQCSEVRSLFF